VSVSRREADGRDWGAIAVADTGPGIPPDKLQLVFQPYYRIAMTDATPEGTGLGLAISHELVRRMGGTIEVASRPGHGSTFTIRVPLAADADATALDGADPTST